MPNTVGPLHSSHFGSVLVFLAVNQSCGPIRSKRVTVLLISLIFSQKFTPCLYLASLSFLYSSIFLDLYYLPSTVMALSQAPTVLPCVSPGKGHEGFVFDKQQQTKQEFHIVFLTHTPTRLSSQTPPLTQLRSSSRRCRRCWGSSASSSRESRATQKLCTWSRVAVQDLLLKRETWASRQHPHGRSASNGTVKWLWQLTQSLTQLNGGETAADWLYWILIHPT